MVKIVEGDESDVENDVGDVEGGELKSKSYRTERARRLPSHSGTANKVRHETNSDTQLDPNVEGSAQSRFTGTNLDSQVFRQKSPSLGVSSAEYCRSQRDRTTNKPRVWRSKEIETL